MARKSSMERRPAKVSSLMTANNHLWQRIWSKCDVSDLLHYSAVSKEFYRAASDRFQQHIHSGQALLFPLHRDALDESLARLYSPYYATAIAAGRRSAELDCILDAIVRAQVPSSLICTSWQQLLDCKPFPAHQFDGDSPPPAALHRLPAVDLSVRLAKFRTVLAISSESLRACSIRHDSAIDSDYTTATLRLSRQTWETTVRQMPQLLSALWGCVSGLESLTLDMPLTNENSFDDVHLAGVLFRLPNLHYLSFEACAVKLDGVHGTATDLSYARLSGMLTRLSTLAEPHGRLRRLRLGRAVSRYLEMGTTGDFAFVDTLNELCRCLPTLTDGIDLPTVDSSSSIHALWQLCAEFPCPRRLPDSHRVNWMATKIVSHLIAKRSVQHARERLSPIARLSLPLDSVRLEEAELVGMIAVIGGLPPLSERGRRTNRKRRLKLQVGRPHVRAFCLENEASKFRTWRIALRVNATCDCADFWQLICAPFAASIAELHIARLCLSDLMSAEQSAKLSAIICRLSLFTVMCVDSCALHAAKPGDPEVAARVIINILLNALSGRRRLLRVRLPASCGLDRLAIRRGYAARFGTAPAMRLAIDVQFTPY